MSNGTDNSKCQMSCWLIAAAVGLLTFILMLSVAGKSLLAAIFLGALVFIFLGLVLNWLFCSSVPETNRSRAAVSGSTSGHASSSAATSGSGSAVAAAATAADAQSQQSDAADVAAKADADAKAKADADAQAKADADAKAKAAAKKKAEAEAKAAAPDFDGDGKLEGTDEGTKPEMLSGPRAGGADDLKRIKGIGPKLEQLCNTMGVYHFDQIAGWSADEVAWVNANLAGFKGRVSRDNWIEQAKLLAAGEETEFSKRVDKGSVY